MNHTNLLECVWLTWVASGFENLSCVFDACAIQLQSRTPSQVVGDGPCGGTPAACRVVSTWTNHDQSLLYVQQLAAKAPDVEAISLPLSLSLYLWSLEE